MIETSVFELTVDQTGRRLSWSLRTDLPCGTQVILSVERRYLDYRDRELVWHMYEQKLIVQATSDGDLNGFDGHLDVDKADANGLAEFNDQLTPYSTGIKDPVGDQIIVVATVGARQAIKAFGKNNLNLAGGVVEHSGGINIVRASAQLEAPIAHRFQPVDFKRA